MAYLYEVTLDDMICAFFMQITNYTCNCSNSMSLKPKDVARCGDPNLLVDAMKSYLGAKDVNTRDCALEGFKLFGSTKRKLDLPHGADCDSHSMDKANDSIPHPSTKQLDKHREESLNSTKHGVAHTAYVLKKNYPPSQWYIARLSYDFAKIF